MPEPQEPLQNPYVELVEQIQQITAAPVTILIVADENFGQKEGVKHLQVASALPLDALQAGLPTMLRELAAEVEQQVPKVGPWDPDPQPPVLSVVAEADGVVGN